MGRRVPAHRRGWAPARFETKDDLQAGGGAVRALIYSRASSDTVGRGKSTGEQTDDSRSRIHKRGWTEAGHFSDNNISASEYSTKERPDWARLLRRIERQDADVLVLWELGRGQRDLEVYASLRKLCLRSGLYYWLVAGNLLDLRNRHDKLNSANQAVQAEAYSDAISEAVQRGIDGSAAEGRPHSHVRYGYRRIYNERTGDYLEQVPDETLRRATAADGRITEYSRAGVVRQIFQDVYDSVPVKSIVDRLNARGVPAPGEANRRPRADGRPYLWHRSTVADMVKSAQAQAYLGHRTHYGEITKEHAWPPLVKEQVFYGARNVLARPERRTAPDDDREVGGPRDARARYLLSYIAECGCGRKLGGSPPRGGRSAKYRCQTPACSAIAVDDLDAQVTLAVLSWFAEADLTAGVGDERDPEMASALARKERAEAKLAEWEALLDDADADIDGKDFAKRKRALAKEVGDARRLVDDLASQQLPDVLRVMTSSGSDPARTWAALEMAQRRKIIRAAFRVLVAEGKAAGTYAKDRLTLVPRYGAAAR
jgi:site-specific DNA recombinase